MIGPPQSSPLFPYPPLSLSSSVRRSPRPPIDSSTANDGGAAPSEARSSISTSSPSSERRRRGTRSSRTPRVVARRSEEHTSELQSQSNLVCRLLLEKKDKDA